jgi:hypothetical protein
MWGGSNSIKSTQHAALIDMLMLGSSSSGSSGPPSSSPSSGSSNGADASPWKIFVYDSFAEDILSPSVDMSELGKCGVTLNLRVDHTREAVGDIPVVYFVRPTEENVAIIISDIKKQLYDSFYLNFTSTLPRALLEKLAQAVTESDKGSLVRRVFDQHMEFVCLEHDFVSLNIPQSYIRLNDPEQRDEDVMGFVDEVVGSLFDVAVTMGSVPVIRTYGETSEAANLVGKTLHERLSEHVRARVNLFSEGRSVSAVSRPLMIIVDRNTDLTVPLHHPWTYQALAHDLMEMKLNTIYVDKEEKGQGKHRYDMHESDQFWRLNRAQPFPKVAESIREKVDAYKVKMKHIESKRHGMGGQDGGISSAMDSLASTITELPELQRQKALLDRHTNIATGILDKLKARELDALFAVESDVLTKSTSLDQAELLSRLEADAKGTFEDKLRLFLIHFLSPGSMRMDDAAVEECVGKLTAIVDAAAASEDAQVQATATRMCSTLKGVEYLQSQNVIRGMRNASSESKSAGGQLKASSSSGGLFSKLAGQVLDQSKGLLSGVKNLLPSTTDLPLTKLVNAFLTNDKSTSGKKCLRLDPIQAAHGQGQQGGRRMSQDQTFDEVVVVVLGGGGYTEAQNLQDYLQKSSSARGYQSSAASGVRRITYVATEVLTPSQMLDQFAAIAASK